MAKKVRKKDDEPNPWDRVPKRNGKLIGILTDKLALNALPSNNGGSKPSQSIKIYKEPQRVHK